MMKDVERLAIDSTDYSEVLFSLHRYYLASKLCKDKKVVDIACGTGYGSYILSKEAKTVVGFDIDKKTIESNKKKYKNANLSFDYSSADKIELKTNSQDIMVSYETIEHLTKEQQEGFLRESKRVLKTDGILLVSTPNRNRTDMFQTRNPFHIGELNPVDFKKLLKKEYDNVCLYYLELNLGTFVFSENQNLSSEVINICDNNLTEKNLDKPIYMLAICSNKDISSINLSSVLSDVKREFLNSLWERIDSNEQANSIFTKRMNELENENRNLSEIVGRIRTNRLYKMYRFLKRK